MNIDDYIDQTTQFEPGKLDLSHADQLLLQGAIGLNGEYGEYLEDESKEELGDAVWYWGRLVRGYRMKTGEDIELPSDPYDVRHSWGHCMRRLHNEVEKWVYQGKDNQDRVRCLIEETYRLIEPCLQDIDADVLRHNISKLG